jgi:hypothetical protein
MLNPGRAALRQQRPTLGSGSLSQRAVIARHDDARMFPVSSLPHHARGGQGKPLDWLEYFFNRAN